MKVRVVNLIILAIGFVHNAYAENHAYKLTDETSRLNYSVGYQVGSDFKRQKFEVRPDAVLQGIEDGLSGSRFLMSKEEMKNMMADLGKQVADMKIKKKQQVADYKEKNENFLKANAKKKGIVTTKSGLQYRVKEKGRGNPPKVDDKVLVHYRGRLIDGTEFDSSVKRGKPSQFKVNQVIKGWTEALQLMKQGDHWLLFIPSELAYGERGNGNLIPPNSALIFDVELISIQ